MKRKSRKKVGINIPPRIARALAEAAHAEMCAQFHPGTDRDDLLQGSVHIRLDSTDALALAKLSGKKFVPAKRRKKSERREDKT